MQSQWYPSYQSLKSVGGRRGRPQTRQKSSVFQLLEAELPDVWGSARCSDRPPCVCSGRLPGAQELYLTSCEQQEEERCLQFMSTNVCFYLQNTFIYKIHSGEAMHLFIHFNKMFEGKYWFSTIHFGTKMICVSLWSCTHLDRNLKCTFCNPPHLFAVCFHHVFLQTSTGETKVDLCSWERLDILSLTSGHLLLHTSRGALIYTSGCNLTPEPECKYPAESYL